MEKRHRFFTPVSFSKEMNRLPKSIKLISLVMFLYSLGWGIITPFTSLYLQTLFDSYTKIGFVLALLPIFALLIDLPMGALANKFSKKKIIQVALFFYIPFSIIYLSLRSLFSFALFRIYHATLATSLWVSAETYTRYHSPPWKASISMALYDAAGTLALIIGPAIGGILFSIFGFSLFHAISIFAGIALLVSFSLPDHDAKNSLRSSVTDLIHWQKVKDLYGEFVTNKPLMKVNFFLFFYRFCFAFLAMLLPLLLKDLGASYFKIGIVFSLFYLPLVFEPYFAMFVNKNNMMKFGLFFSMIMFFFLFANDDISFVFLYSIILALCFAATIPILQGRLTELMPKNQVGDLTGFNFVFSDIANAVAPLMAGIIADYYGIRYVFLIGAAISLLLFLLVFTKVFKDALFGKAI